MKLDLTSFKKAISSLKAALDEHGRQHNDFLRDSCIQRFEYTYELAWKMLKRYLEMNEPTSELIDSLNFSDLIRRGNEKGLLLNDWSKWRIYREARNKTSHTYDEKVADDVFFVIPDFMQEAEFLYEKISAC